ncbi:MAG: hypothetical protein ABJC09_00800 [Terriglobia bacterium]
MKRCPPSAVIVMAAFASLATLKGQTAPVILAGGIVNAAALPGAPAMVAPGSIVSIYGSGMASSFPGAGAQASGFPLPTTLSGAQVFMNGIPAPIYYADASQINAQVPWEVAGANSLSVQVRYLGMASNTETVPLTTVAPGIFVVLHALDYAAVTTARPVTPGEYLIIYCTGLGSVSNAPETGGAASGTQLSSTTSAVKAKIGGVTASVAYAGLAPGLAGLYQVNVRVPQDSLPGDNVQIVLSFDGSPLTASASVAYLVPQVLSTFQLPELFGASWPDQPIEFRYDGGAPPQNSTRMRGPNGLEVPFQWVSSCSDATALKGCIAVRSGLAANSSNVWTLESGVAPAANPLNAVRLAQADKTWEVSNGLTGFRIVTGTGNPRPWNLAPLQGIQLPGGGWTGVGDSPNLLYSEMNPAGSGACVGCALHTPAYSATGYEVNVVDSGPVKVVVKATYTFNRPRYAYGSTAINSSGAGHYTLTLTLYANSKSILVDEDSDMQMSWYLPLYNELQPDIARFRGHDSLNSSGVNDPGCGYESPGAVTGAGSASPIVMGTSAAANLSNGQAVLISGVQGNGAANGLWFAKTSGFAANQFALYQDAALTRPVAGNGSYSGGGAVKPAYRGQSLNPVADAFLDIGYTLDRAPSYSCSATTYRKLVTNYPAADHSAGWYSMLYQSGAGKNAPVVGLYTGRFSQLQRAATGPSMPGIYSSNKHWITGTQAAGIEVENLLRGPDNSVSPLVHRNWGIWVSTQADLLAPGLHQPIADEQNSLTGINLSRLYTYQFTYPDPPGGWKWQYLSTDSASRLVGLVRNGTSTCGSANCYYNLLKNSETSPWGSALLNMWQGNSTASVQAALNTAAQIARNIVQTLANGDNRFDGPLGYYQLGLSTSPETAVLNAILMDSNSTAAQRTTAKAILALFGSLFWDNDWWPIDNNTGSSVGLANQIQQYLQYRTQAAAAAPSNPFFAALSATASAYPVNDFAASFSATGAAAASTHYQSAFFEPLILNYLSSSLNGGLSMTDPKWAAYANWELSIQTPPEPRFGNIRKGYSNGDGNTESDVRTGMLATALYPVNPALAGNLIWAWQQSNSPTVLTEDSQFVTTLVAIDPTIPAIAPQLGSINVPGYHSAERHNFATPNETAVWFINGGFYSIGGHRHADDGQVSIYAHTAPLAIDWNANLYSPETPGRFMHNSVVFDSELNRLWSADNTGLADVPGLLKNPTNTEFAAFTKSTTSSADFTAGDGTTWTRTVRTMNFNPSYPVIYVKDSFAGPGAGAAKTLTWNLMATGAVDTPVGAVTPTTRFSSGCQSPPAALPSNGTVSGLAQGLNQFSFTGAIWPRHETQGINWDLYSVASTSNQQFMIGNWGHGCHDSRDAAEYKAANGTSFAEVQHILRLHDTGGFDTVILPYRKTETPTRKVSQESCGIQISQGGENTCFNNSSATYSNGTAGVLSVYDASSQTAMGITANGGPQEIVVQPNQITWTIGGIQAGPRTLTLPGSWFPDQPVAKDGNVFSYTYAGGAQTPAVTITFTQIP